MPAGALPLTTLPTPGPPSTLDPAWLTAVRAVRAQGDSDDQVRVFRHEDECPEIKRQRRSGIVDEWISNAGDTVPVIVSGGRPPSGARVADALPAVDAVAAEVPKSTGWLELPEGRCELHIRQYYADWFSEQPADLMLLAGHVFGPTDPGRTGPSGVPSEVLDRGHPALEPAVGVPAEGLRPDRAGDHRVRGPAPQTVGLLTSGDRHLGRRFRKGLGVQRQRKRHRTALQAPRPQRQARHAADPAHLASHQPQRVHRDAAVARISSQQIAVDVVGGDGCSGGRSLGFAAP